MLLLSENVPNLNTNDRSTCKLLFRKRDHPFPGYILIQVYRVLLSQIPLPCPALSTSNPSPQHFPANGSITKTQKRNGSAVETNKEGWRYFRPDNQWCKTAGKHFSKESPNLKDNAIETQPTLFFLSLLIKRSFHRIPPKDLQRTFGTIRTIACTFCHGLGGSWVSYNSRRIRQ